VLGKIDIDESSSKSVVEQLREALVANAAKVIDLFKEWDENGDGRITKKEFRTAMPELGLDVPRKTVDALFDKFDPDRSGSITQKELGKILRAPGTSVLGSIDIDEHSSKSVPEQLKEALAKNATRAIELFREWDTNKDGFVTKQEFHKAMPLLGLHAPKKDIDAVFDSFDPDRSGKISSKELTVILRNKGSVLGAIDLDEESGKTVVEQLRDALAKNSGKVIDLFREWDTNGDGNVSKKEFHKAMPLLGLNVAAKEIDALFDAFDPDQSGSIGHKELQKLLKSKR